MENYVLKLLIYGVVISIVVGGFSVYFLEIITLIYRKIKNKPPKK